MSPLRLYINRHWLQEGRSHIPLLYPFLGAVTKAEDPHTARAWSTHGFRSQDFSLVYDVREADYVVLPHAYRWAAAQKPELVAAVLREGTDANVPVLLDDTGDVYGPRPTGKHVLLRVDGYRFQKEHNVIVIPLPVEDILEQYLNGKPSVREKSQVPSVGFVGWSQIPVTTRIKTVVKELPVRVLGTMRTDVRAKKKGVLWRQEAMGVIRSTRGVDARLISRPSFGGRTDTAENLVQWRKDFVENLLENDYALCVKGDANISFRFYETLSAGRIPLFLDTECVLPMEDNIDYSSFCVFVNHKEIRHLGESLIDFHSKCSPERFKLMQHGARAAFEQFLRMDSFSPFLARALRERLVLWR